MPFKNKNAGGQKMKRLMVSLLVIMTVLTGCGKNIKNEVINIGINQLVEFEALDQCREGFIQALEENGYIDGENIKIDYQNAQGDMNIAQTISKKFAFNLCHCHTLCPGII